MIKACLYGHADVFIDICIHVHFVLVTYILQFCDVQNGRRLFLVIQKRGLSTIHAPPVSNKAWTVSLVSLQPVRVHCKYDSLKMNFCESRYYNLLCRATDEQTPILFTKPRSQVQLQAFRQLPNQLATFQNRPAMATSQEGKKSIVINVGRDLLHSIHSNVEQFTRHLGKTQHEAVGRFNPWQIVEE